MEKRFEASIVRPGAYDELTPQADLLLGDDAVLAPEWSLASKDLGHEVRFLPLATEHALYHPDWKGYADDEDELNRLSVALGENAIGTSPQDDLDSVWQDKRLIDIETESMLGALMSAVGLMEREKIVLELRRGLGNVGEHTLLDISEREEFGIGKQTVGRIDQRAMGRFKRAIRRQDLGSEWSDYV